MPYGYRQDVGAGNHPPLRGCAYGRLRSMILNGELPPGSPIRDVELANSLGLSNTPIREALAKLSHEGWIEAPPFRTKRVSCVRRQDAIDQVETLRLLAAYLYPRALAAITDETIARLWNHFHQLERALERQDRVAVADAWLDLTDEIFGSAGNRYLADIVLRTQHQLERAINTRAELSVIPAALEPARLTIQAVEARDIVRLLSVADGLHDRLETLIRTMPEMVEDIPGRSTTDGNTSVGADA